MSFRHLASLFAATAVVLMGACAGDSTAPGQGGPAVSYLIVSGNAQTGTVGEDLPLPIRVLATDANSQPVPNVVVNFVVTTGGGHVFAGAALTDAAGIAAEIWTLGTVAGAPQQLEVRAVNASGSKQVYGVFTATAATGTPTGITRVAGDGQTAAAGTSVPVPPAVKLTDQYGNPVPNYPVTFTVSAGGGSVTGSPATSDAQGIATVGSWVLGAFPGSNTLTATAAALPGVPASFSATATQGAAPVLAVETAPSATAQSGIAFATQPAIQVQDVGGTAVHQAGILVTASLNGSGAVLGGTTTVATDANGRAAFGDLLLLGTVGNYSLTFTASGVTSAGSSTITLTAGLPAVLGLDGGDGQTATAGGSVALAPSVRVTDLSGNPVAGVPVVFAVTSGGGSVTGGTTLTNASGIAFAGSWTLGPVAGGNSLTASSAAIPSGSVVFNATAIAPLLALATAPSTATQNGLPLAVQPAIQLRDGQAADLALSGVPVTVTLNGAGATLSGTTTVSTDANGRAAFTNLVITGAAGSGYTLSFSSPGLATITSGALSVTAGAPVSLVLAAGNGQSAPAGTAVAVAPAVTVLDQSGNVVLGVSVTFAVSAGGGSVSGAAAVSNASGIAAVGSWVLGTTAGANGLVATSTAVPAASVSFSATATTSLPGTWAVGLATMPIARRYSASAVLNNVLYVVGGRTNTAVAATNQSYNPVTNVWATKMYAPTFRAGAHAGAINGLLYVVGGRGTGPTLNTMESYNPATNSWTVRAPMPEAKEFGASVVINGLLYVVGGGGPNGLSATMYAYDPVTNSWTQKASMPAGRNGIAATVVNGRLYVVGGALASGPDGAMLVYDPQTDTWTALASLPTPRYHLNAAAYNGKIYAVGGYLGQPAQNRVDIYDPQTNSWVQGASMPTARVGMAMEFINGVMYAAGGFTGDANNGGGGYTTTATTGVNEKYVP